jgi:hypothetical protein
MTQRNLSNVGLCIVWAVLLPGAALLSASQACAHDAPSGMVYPPMCCGGTDCKPIPESSVKAVPGGWLIKATGEVISQALVLRSTDGLYHRCSSEHRDDTPTICLILPPLGQ